MALGATKFTAPAIVPDFSAGMPTVASGGQVLPSQEIVLKTPMDIFIDVFLFSMYFVKYLISRRMLSQNIK